MSIHNSKRKHRVIALVMCFLVLTLSGCSRGNGNYNQVTAVDRVSSQTSTSISSEHKLLDGREQYTIHVSDGEELAVLISILNQNGSLSLTIGKSGSTPVYTGNDIESSSFTVYLRESGDYSVIIDANNHEGSSSLDRSAVLFTSTPDAPERSITYSMLLSGKETPAYLGISDLTANFSFTDGTTASLTWFYVDGGFVYGSTILALPKNLFIDYSSVKYVRSALLVLKGTITLISF